MSCISDLFNIVICVRMSYCIADMTERKTLFLVPSFSCKSHSKDSLLRLTTCNVVMNLSQCSAIITSWFVIGLWLRVINMVEYVTDMFVLNAKSAKYKWYGDIY